MTTKKKGLTPAQLEKMRVKLTERARRLRDKSRDKLDEVEDSADDGGGDAADRASLSLDLDLMVDSAARETKELQNIEDAIAKIEAGTYGVCEECDDVIALARLEYVPNAQFCIECQEKLETQGALPAGAEDEFQILE